MSAFLLQQFAWQPVLSSPPNEHPFLSYQFMDSRSQRDLPEVVAEILIEQHAMREDVAGLRREMKEEIGGLRQEMREDNAALRNELRTGLAEMAQTFNSMTNAILDAMNRGNDRYGATNNRQDSTDNEVDQLKTRVSKLENPGSEAA